MEKEKASRTCSRLSEITSSRLFSLCSSTDLIRYIYQKLNIAPRSLSLSLSLTYTPLQRSGDAHPSTKT